MGFVVAAIGSIIGAVGSAAAAGAAGVAGAVGTAGTAAASALGSGIGAVGSGIGAAGQAAMTGAQALGGAAGIGGGGVAGTAGAGLAGPGLGAGTAMGQVAGTVGGLGTGAGAAGGLGAAAGAAGTLGTAAAWGAKLKTAAQVASAVGSGASAVQAYQQGKAAEKYADEQAAVARSRHDDWVNTWSKVEKDVAEGAQAGLPGGYYADRAGAAAALAQKNAEAQQRMLLNRYGVDPSSPRAQAALADLQRVGSQAAAGARTSAREKVAEEEWKRKIQAVNIGKGIPGQVMDAYGQASERSLGLADRHGSDAKNLATFAYDIWKEGKEDSDPFGVVKQKTLGGGTGNVAANYDALGRPVASRENAGGAHGGTSRSTFNPGQNRPPSSWA